MKILITYNPRSGKNRFKRKLKKIIEILKAKGFDEITIYESKKPNSITAYIKENLIVYKYDTILVSGGDGTLHEAINGLMNIPFEMRPKLLYFPTGTVNDVGHILGLNKRAFDNINLIDDENVVLWDICSLNGEYFDYVGAVGKFTPASYQTNHPKIKKVFGVFYYISEAFKEIRRSYHMKMTITDDAGKVIEGRYCLMLAMNTSRIGSLYISPSEVQLDDGKISMFLFDDTVNVRIVKLIKFFLSGGKSKNGVTRLDGSKFNIVTQKAFRYNLDGEKAAKLGGATIEVHQKQIPIYVSPASRKTYFKNQ